MSTAEEKINKVENKIATKIGIKYAVVLCFGTLPIHLAMKMKGVKHDNHIFCFGITFNITMNLGVYAVGILVLIDTKYDV